MVQQNLILQLRLLLLDLISSVAVVEQSALDALSQAHWSQVMVMVQQHRLGPLLHWQLVHHRNTLRLPEAVRKALAQAYAHSAMRNLQVQRELVLTDRLLEAAGITSVALKGACLAWQVYPHPALRPLRDLDVLVPLKDGLRAYEVLLSGGMTRIHKYGYEGDPEAAIDVKQHLPPLLSASGQLNIELHTRIFHISEEHRGHADLSDDPDFWARATSAQLAGQRLRFESPTDLLLHLIVHAVYDHEFTNGPLVLSDVAFLLQTHRIDWPMFWAMAERFAYVQGCCAALHLTERYWGELSVDWCGHGRRLSDAEMEHIALLLLRDFDLRNEVILRANFLERKSWSGKMRYAMAKVFISKERMAALFPVHKDDWRIYLYYPVRWGKLVLEKFLFLLPHRHDDIVSLDVSLVHQLRKVLEP